MQDLILRDCIEGLEFMFRFDIHVLEFRIYSSEFAVCSSRFTAHGLQGYLAQKKTLPPRTLP